jgi:hypothetical protein
MDDYSDIIKLPHHQSQTRKHMSLHDRAAQFAPFAALTGFDGQISETARLTDSRPAVSREEAEDINTALNLLMEGISEKPFAKITYFVPDPYKKGGSIQEKTGNIRRIDTVLREIIFTDKTVISIDEVLKIIL